MSAEKELKTLKRAVIDLLYNLPELGCSDFHHRAKDIHPDDPLCPVSIRHYTALAKLQFLIK